MFSTLIFCTINQPLLRAQSTNEGQKFQALVKQNQHSYAVSTQVDRSTDYGPIYLTLESASCISLGTLLGYDGIRNALDVANPQSAQIPSLVALVLVITGLVKAGLAFQDWTTFFYPSQLLKVEEFDTSSNDQPVLFLARDNNSAPSLDQPLYNELIDRNPVSVAEAFSHKTNNLDRFESIIISPFSNGILLKEQASNPTYFDDSVIAPLYESSNISRIVRNVPDQYNYTDVSFDKDYTGQKSALVVHEQYQNRDTVKQASTQIILMVNTPKSILIKLDLIPELIEGNPLFFVQKILKELLVQEGIVSIQTLIKQGSDFVQKSPVLMLSSSATESLAFAEKKSMVLPATLEPQNSAPIILLVFQQFPKAAIQENNELVTPAPCQAFNMSSRMLPEMLQVEAGVNIIEIEPVEQQINNESFTSNADVAMGRSSFQAQRIDDTKEITVSMSEQNQDGLKDEPSEKQVKNSLKSVPDQSSNDPEKTSKRERQIKSSLMRAIRDKYWKPA